MSTPPGAAGARAPARENIFTRRIGPLPMWGWLAISAVIILGWSLYKNRKSPAASQSSANASQVPQFVNQTYTTVMPPSSPAPETDKEEDEDEARTHKKRPVNRRHPTHDEDRDKDKTEDERRRRKPARPRRHPPATRWPGQGVSHPGEAA